MKNILKYSLLMVMAVSLTACLGEFDEDITTNPNAVSTPYTGNLLTASLRSLPGTINSTTGGHYVQYYASSQYQGDGSDVYGTDQFEFAGWYSGVLANLERIKIMNSDPATAGDALPFGSNANQIAVANILQSYFYLHLTNQWGMVPYSQALGALTGSTELPSYDAQEDIYDGVFATLETAVSNLSGGVDNDLAKSDFLFDGDTDRWAQFANTMRMFAALQISEVDAALAESQFADAFSDGVIALDNSGNVNYPHLADANNENAWFSRFRSRRDHCVANTIVNFMQIDTYVDPHDGQTGNMDVMMDPRLTIYADPASNSLEYVGMLNGVGTPVAAAIFNDDVSFFGSAMRQQDTPEYIYTAAQVNFALAEAVERGWTVPGAGTVQQHYEDGILMSFRQHGVAGAADADYATYMTNSAVVFNAGTAMEQVLTQKWAANYGNGYAAWNDWRRTGFPVLTPAVAAENINDGGIIPLRHGYGNNTRDLNPANYEAAVAAQGEDRLGTALWWDN